MRTESVIRPVQPGDVEQLAQAMRPEDAAEVLADAGLGPLEALQRSLGNSFAAWSAELGGELAAMFGLVEGPRSSMLGPPDYDRIWLLTGRAVERFPLAYVRTVRALLAALLQLHPVLACRVDGRYLAMVRMASALGAEIGPPEPWGASGLPFHLVIWRSR